MEAGDDDFDLEISESGSVSRGVTIGAETLRWKGGICAFSDIAVIRLGLDTEEVVRADCVVIRHDGSSLLVGIKGDGRGETAVYRAFVTAFIERLGPFHRDRIKFLPTERGRIGPVAVATILAACVAMFVWGIATNQAAAAPENQLIIPICGIMIPVFALLLWKSISVKRSPPPIDLAHIQDFLPSTYYDRD